MSDQLPPTPEMNAPVPDESAQTSAPDSSLKGYQDWFLLHALVEAPDQRLKQGDLNKKVDSKRVAQHLQLTKAQANQRLEQMQQEGLIQTQKVGRAVLFQTTDRGKEYLSTLQPHPAFQPKPPPQLPEVAEEVRKYQEAYLLLQLLEGEGHTLTKTEANKKLTGELAKDLEMNTTVANFRRQQLAERGFLRIEKQARSEVFRLTAAGREELGGQEQYPGTTFKLKGSAINELMTIVRESQAALRAPEPVPATMPSDLKQSAYEEFQELLRERHSADGLVPIHELRQRIREKYGEEAGRHDVLDDELRQMRREGLVRLSPISDRGRVPSEQLEDSIPGIDETLFYVEVAHAQHIPG
jgi:predicted transcriptional regulator